MNQCCRIYTINFARSMSSTVDVSMVVFQTSNLLNYALKDLVYYFICIDIFLSASLKCPLTIQVSIL